MNQNLFAELSLVPELLRAIGEMGFSEPTPIQAQSIPLILEGRDVVGRSQTGTGKTAAFGIPAIQMVDPNLDRRMAQILLLCPTRELAVQACEELKNLLTTPAASMSVPFTEAHRSNARSFSSRMPILLLELRDASWITCAAAP